MSINNPVAEYDDGSKVYISSYAGGAAKEGAWGTLTLMFVDPDGNHTIRPYVAAGPARPWPVQETKDHE